MIKVIHISESGQHSGVDVYIGRKYRSKNPSPLANPYPLAEGVDRVKSIQKYRLWLMGKIKQKDPKVLAELRRIEALSKKEPVNLVCFCAPRACHGDVIKQFLEDRGNNEGWYPVVGFEGIYEVSKNLEVRRLQGFGCKKQRMLNIYWRTFRNSSRKVPTPTVCLCWKGKRYVSDVRKLKRDAIKKYLRLLDETP